LKFHSAKKKNLTDNLLLLAPPIEWKIAPDLQFVFSLQVQAINSFYCQTDVGTICLILCMLIKFDLLPILGFDFAVLDLKINGPRAGNSFFSDWLFKFTSSQMLSAEHNG
jgi:hypothetical protein